MKKKFIIIYCIVLLFSLIGYKPQAMVMEEGIYINNAKRDLLVLM